MAPPRRIARIINRLLQSSAGFLLPLGLLSCRSSQTSVSSASDVAAAFAATQLQLRERYVALALVHIGETLATPEERRFFANLPSIAPASVESSADLEARTRSMLSANFSSEERLILLSQGELGIAFALLAEGQISQARTLARFVLSKDALSPQIQRWALSAWSMAHALELDREILAGRTLAPADFNALQKLHCEEVCALPGWRLVSIEDGGSLSRKGYSDRVLTRLQFDLANQKRPAWLTRVLERNDEALRAPQSAETQSAERIVEKIARLNDRRRFAEAAREGENDLATRRALRHPTPNPGACDGVFVHTLVAQAQLARLSQKRGEFLSKQQDLVASLENPACNAAALALNEENFASFAVDARLWYARLLWESQRNAEAESYASRALAEAAAIGDWQLYLEAAQVLIGRIAFERDPPARLIARIEHVRANYDGPDNEEFAAWSAMRLGLIRLLDAKPAAAEAAFEALAKSSDAPATRAKAFYWKGRAQLAQGRAAEAAASWRRAGAEDPLSYYDTLAGARLSTRSGLASSVASTPFTRPWSEIQERWIGLRVGRPFALFRPELWFSDATLPEEPWSQNKAQHTGPTLPSESEETSRAHKRAFENSVSASLLLATSLRAGLGVTNFEKFTAHLRDSGSFYSRLLRSEALWSQQAYLAFHSQGARHLPSAVRIAWLLYALGDYKTAIPFVALFKNELLRQEEDLAFLYFIFYPRPYAEAYSAAARVCGVDENLLYAVSRQESLFQANATSPAGAVGLMQLLPETAKRVVRRIPGHENDTVDASTLLDPRQNTLAGACYLKELLARYQGDPVSAVSAYNAGEAMVDAWRARRDPTHDNPFFVEWIPFQETREYTQRVLRNHVNLRWIYGAL